MSSSWQSLFFCCCFDTFSHFLRNSCDCVQLLVSPSASPSVFPSTHCLGWFAEIWNNWFKVGNIGFSCIWGDTFSCLAVVSKRQTSSSCNSFTPPVDAAMLQSSTLTRCVWCSGTRKQRTFPWLKKFQIWVSKSQERKHQNEQSKATAKRICKLKIK